MRVAIFDFDGTLYKKETFKILMSHLKNHPVYHPNYKPFFRWLVPRYIGYKAKVYPESTLKKQSMHEYLKAFDGLSGDELSTYFRDVSKEMKDDFNVKVVEELKQHRADGVHVMVVSGAYTMFLKSAIDHLPVDTVIGTEIMLARQTVNAEQAIDHVNGIRKTEKVYEALQDEKIDWENSYAYADSYSDIPVLELVGNPVVVQPDKKLEAIAMARNWKVI